MSFAKNLTKGFIRAAVNQVGRDGGRVVSNQVYGNRNYIPIANVNPNSQFTQSEYRNIPQDAGVKNKPLSTEQIILFICLSLFLFPIGNLGVLIYGIIRYFDKTATIEWVEVQKQFTQDRRTKTGTRYIGDAFIKQTQKIPAPSDVIAINRKNGLTAILTSLVIGLIIGITLIFK